MYYTEERVCDTPKNGNPSKKCLNVRQKLGTTNIWCLKVLNNFCFHVFAQKWVFVIMSHVTCHISHVRCHMSQCDMLFVKCLSWSSGHSEQILFSCVCSKVSICNYVTCHMSHVTCHMSYVKCLCWSLGHAEQFLFSCLCSNVAVYGCKRQCFFLTPPAPSPVSQPIIELVPS